VRPHSRGWRRDADFVGDYGRVPRAQRRFGNDRKHEDGCKAEVRPVTVLTKPDPARERPRDQAAIEDGRNDDQADGAFVKHYRPDDQAKKQAGHRMQQHRADAELKRSPNPRSDKPNAERNE